MRALTAVSLCLICVLATAQGNQPVYAEPPSEEHAAIIIEQARAELLQALREESAPVTDEVVRQELEHERARHRQQLQTINDRLEQMWEARQHSLDEFMAVDRERAIENHNHREAVDQIMAPPLQTTGSARSGEIVFQKL